MKFQPPQVRASKRPGAHAFIRMNIRVFEPLISPACPVEQGPCQTFRGE
jgi:hypothetical protein